MSRIFHLSDTHIDRMLGRISRMDDIRTALSEVIEIMADFKPNLTLLTGDLFQGVRPSTEGMKLAFDFLREAERFAPVEVICGNHDSPPLFEVFQKILGEKSRIHFISRIMLPNEGGIRIYPGENKEIIKFAGLPFVHANRALGGVKFDGADNWMSEYPALVGRYENLLYQGLRSGWNRETEVLIFGAHLHVGGAKFSGSERMWQVSDAYGTKAEDIPKVNYAAFGHLHKPQNLPGGVVGRYAGSVVQMDFGEEDEEKSVTLIEVTPKNKTIVEVRPLKKQRTLKRYSGSLEELKKIAPFVTDQILRLTVKSESPIEKLSDKVAELFPKATIFEIMEECEERRLTVLERVNLQQSPNEGNFVDLFKDFLSEAGTKNGAATEVLQSFSQLFEGVENETPECFTETEALEKFVRNS